METVTNSGFNDSEANDDAVNPYAPSRAGGGYHGHAGSEASGSLSEFLARVLDHLVPDVWFEETVQELIDQSVCPAAVGGIPLCRLTY